MSRRAAAVFGIALATAAPPAAHRATYPDAPPPAMTGGFGEPTCVSCHFAPAVRDTSAAVGIEGLPARFEPGRCYALTISLERAGMERAGFQLSARLAEGDGAGHQAGALEAEGPAVAVTAQEGVQYAHQTAAGNAPSAGRARWRVRWTAPEARAAIVFHVAANAANGDDSALGDIVVAIERRVEPAP